MKTPARLAACTLVIATLAVFAALSARAAECIASVSNPTCTVEVESRDGWPDRGILHGRVNGVGYVELSAKDKSNYWIYVTSPDGVVMEDAKDGHDMAVNTNESCSGTKHPDCQSLREEEGGLYYLKMVGTGKFRVEVLYRGTHERGDALDTHVGNSEYPELVLATKDKRTLQYIQGSASVGDRDWWRTELLGNRTLYFRTISRQLGGGPGAVALSLFDADGNPVETKTRVESLCQLVKVRVPTAGVYWVQVANDSESNQGYNLWLLRKKTCY